MPQEKQGSVAWTPEQRQAFLQALGIDLDSIHKGPTRPPVAPGGPIDGKEPDTHQRILLAAARIFGEQGYAGATTRAVAEAADVNEVTLFRHFGSKKNLMQAVIAEFSAVPGLDAAMAGQITGRYREDLLKLGTHYLTTMLQRRSAILMALCTAERLTEIREVIAQPPARQREILGTYLRQQMAFGVVRRLTDPGLAAQAFFGMLFDFAINHGLQAPDSRPEIEATVRQFVDIFVQGTIAHQPEG